MRHILTVIPVSEENKRLLEASAGEEFDFIWSSRNEASDEMIQSAEIIIGNVSAEKLAGSKNLKWFQLGSAGADEYMKPGALPEGTILTNSTGAYGLAISEHMLACLLSLMKKLPLYMEDQKAHVWGDRGNVTSIDGAKVLVVGMGDIGGDFGRKMQALGAHVTGIRRKASEKPDWAEAVYTTEALPELIGNMDVVAITLPGTKETKGLFDREMIGRMKPGAYLLNIGRGTIVDSMALADALNTGRLAGAAVDVTDPEPLPEDHPLWDAENIIITPHISGFYHLPETHERIVRIAAENLRRYTAGEALKNVVDFETGYRKR